MPKLKDMLNEAMKVKLGEIQTDKDHPPFAKNEAEWKKQWDKKLTEAEMDKRFAKEFETNCKALLNHIKHELSKGPKGQTRAQLQLYAKEIAKAMEVPKKLAKIVGEE